MHDGSHFITSKKYRIDVLDRVGTGDAFAAGFIFGLSTGRSSREALEMGVAAACLKHSVYGDFNITTLEEVERFISGYTKGRVRR
jgi:2-dehydro-3-deoxygluconokinase